MKKDPTVLEAKRYEIFCCQQDTPLLEACRQMVAKDISSLVVANKDGYLAGIITRTDLLRARLEHETWTALPVGKVMCHEVVTVTPETTLAAVSQLLVEKHIHRVVVVRPENGRKRPLAVVSDSDILYHMAHLRSANP